MAYVSAGRTPRLLANGKNTMNLFFRALKLPGRGNR